MAALFYYLVWLCGGPSVVVLVVCEDGLFAYCSLGESHVLLLDLSMCTCSCVVRRCMCSCVMGVCEAVWWMYVKLYDG